MNNLCELSFKAMGGTFTYKGYLESSMSKEKAIALFKDAHNEVLRIEKKFTEFAPSLITKINDSAGCDKVSIDDELIYLLEKSGDYFKKSKGLFDPTYASYLSVWRQKEKLGLLEKHRLKALVDFSRVQINLDDKTIYLPFKDQKIGLGGIGKGYAVDRAFNFLKENGFRNFSVNGSGDMRVHSSENAPRKWKVGIRNPFSMDSSKSAGIVQIANGSVSTSGSYIQNKNDNLRDHHIVAKQYDETIPVSVTVVADTCMDTDVWATISMAQGIADSLKSLNEQNIFGVLIDSSGTSHLSNKAMAQFGL
ncbi:FAD:protein FMN transferase [Halobacteriovorax sp. HLS]|uniref:FAD:protein FMN transferase n=1 Tax=Halobacteriovorax sp. HLS TaxID=2234000 RepID=UPI000FDA88E6|nr:FAD:protein FMN transferase [Halobacteriovorax sp. HLS]